MPRVLWKQQSLERWSRVSEEKQEEEERGGEEGEDPGRTCRLLEGCCWMLKHGAVEGPVRGLTCILTRIALSAVIDYEVGEKQGDQIKRL